MCAITGVLGASRRQMAIIGFCWLGLVTGIGGRTVRGLLLEPSVFWVREPAYVIETGVQHPAQGDGEQKRNHVCSPLPSPCASAALSTAWRSYSPRDFLACPIEDAAGLVRRQLIDDREQVGGGLIGREQLALGDMGLERPR
jgi:Glycine transporter